MEERECLEVSEPSCNTWSDTVGSDCTSHQPITDVLDNAPSSSRCDSPEFIVPDRLFDNQEPEVIIVKQECADLCDKSEESCSFSEITAVESRDQQTEDDKRQDENFVDCSRYVDGMQPEMESQECSGTRNGKPEVDSQECLKTGSVQQEVDSQECLETGNEKIFKCTVCKYKTRLSCNLIRHMRTHTGEKKFLCTICGYQSYYSTDLRRHARLHTGEKPFECSTCDYKCSQFTTLKNHMRRHTGEKPYLCTLCGYRFVQLSNLKYHMRTHTGEKRKSLVCSVCDYRCSDQSLLEKHLRSEHTTHTCKKPFSCSMCDFKCSSSTYLKKHIRTHTDDKSV